MFPITERINRTRTTIDRHRKGAESRWVSNYEHKPCLLQWPLVNRLDQSQRPSSNRTPNNQHP